MSVDYEQTRAVTHEKLEGHLDDLGCGRDIKSLVSFAKAYLGMYLDLEKNIEPDERVKLLADEDVVENIWLGFSFLLNSKHDITLKIIAQAYVEDTRLDIGYILLAALDREIRVRGSVPELDDELMSIMICFYYINRNELGNLWIGQCAETHAPLFANTMIEFWQAMEAMGSNKKPGFREILYKPEYNLILQSLTLPVMRAFAHLNKYFLRSLLLSAFRYAPMDELLAVSCDHIENEKNMPVVNQVYWLSTAYLLMPDKYESILFNYVGRTREKALPMLNYIEAVLSQEGKQRFDLTASMLASLLHMIAPKFRPVRDKFGNLDDNAQKIIWLFDLLRKDKSIAAQHAISDLKKIRVMKLYSEYL